MTGRSPAPGEQQNMYYLSEAFYRGRLSHAYIIEGSKASGKEAFADQLAAALLCDQNRHPKPMEEGRIPLLTPCGICPSCRKAASGNHPDIIHVRHEKETVLSVQEIRDQVVSDMAIQPYYGSYKIYIIPDAGLMNENAQNALLKTIEEPDDYGMLLLLTDNADGLLQTIRSRCIRISMKPVPRSRVAEDLLRKDDLHLPELLGRIRDMNALDINVAAKEMEAADRKQIMEILQLFFRDVLVYKSTGKGEWLYFTAYADRIRRMAQALTYEQIQQILLAWQEADARLKASVKAEAVFENLLLTVRREILQR